MITLHTQLSSEIWHRNGTPAFHSSNCWLYICTFLLVPRVNATVDERGSKCDCLMLEEVNMSHSEKPTTLSVCYSFVTYTRVQQMYSFIYEQLDCWRIVLLRCKKLFWCISSLPCHILYMTFVYKHDGSTVCVLMLFYNIYHGLDQGEAHPLAYVIPCEVTSQEKDGIQRRLTNGRQYRAQSRCVEHLIRSHQELVSKQSFSSFWPTIVESKTVVAYQCRPVWFIWIRKI